MSDITIVTHNFELFPLFNYETREPQSKRNVLRNTGTVSCWDEMLEVFEGIQMLTSYNVPVIVEINAGVGLKNFRTGVIKPHHLNEFNTSSSPETTLEGIMKCFVCRGDCAVPTVRDIKKFVNNCEGCGLQPHCEKKFKLPDDHPAYFDNTCSPCIRPLDVNKDIIHYQDRTWCVNKKLKDFFEKQI